MQLQRSALGRRPRLIEIRIAHGAASCLRHLRCRLCLMGWKGRQRPSVCCTARLVPQTRPDGQDLPAERNAPPHPLETRRIGPELFYLYLPAHSTYRNVLRWMSVLRQMRIIELLLELGMQLMIKRA